MRQNYREWGTVRTWGTQPGCDQGSCREIKNALGVMWLLCQLYMPNGARKNAAVEVIPKAGLIVWRDTIVVTLDSNEVGNMPLDGDHYLEQRELFCLPRTVEIKCWLRQKE